MSTPASTQSDTVYAGLSTFYKGVEDAINNSTTVPTVGDVSASLSYTDLQTAASINSRATPTFSVGSVVETTHLAAAVLREYGMRVKGKAEYYADGAASNATESDYYDKLKYSHRAAVLGGSMNGSLTQ